MKQITAFLLAVGVCIVPVGAVESPELLRSESALSLGKSAAQLKIKFTGSSYVSISGNVSLRGNEYIRDGATYVYANLTGSGYLTGSGGVQAGNVSINERVSIHIREGQSYVSEYVHVSEQVSVYKNGRYVGSTNVTGTIHVSGHISGNWLRLNGSGNVSGSLFIREDKTR